MFHNVNPYLLCSPARIKEVFETALLSLISPLFHHILFIELIIKKETGGNKISKQIKKYKIE